MTPLSSAFFDRLRRLSPNVVPVVGAGMAAACSAPSATKLTNALAEAAGEPSLSDGDLFEVADALETTHGRTWVQEATAQAINSAQLIPSRAMLALTLVPGRVIATTNYDNAIELAAERHGLRPVTLLPSSAPKLLQVPADDELLVVHLHGVASEPSSIILTDSSYTAAEEDERLQLAVRALAASRTLVFLGHSLAAREAHLRRDVRRIVELFGAGEHLLVCSESDTALGDLAAFEAATGVHPEPLPNPDRDYEFVVTVARTLGAPPLLPSTVPLRLWSEPVDQAYEPVPVAPVGEVATDEKRRAWRYSGLLGQKPLHADRLTHEFRLLLVGQPGMGKTQTSLRLTAASQDAVYIRLGAVTPAGTNEDDASVLAHWVDQAGYARRDGVPKVTKQGIESDVFAFFLDGLDEVRAEKRASVLRTIGNLAAHYPQHWWVLTSRRVPELPVGSLNGFAEYEMAPTREWLIRYAEQRGVTQAQLDQIAQRAPGLGELLEIPLFAAAAVEAIISGRKLPASPLELLLSFASKGMDEEETRLRSDREGIDRWLDRLALTMLAQRIDSIDQPQAVAPALRGDLAEDVTVDWLVARVLVAEQGGEVRFASRTLRDSRAARAIREHPEAAAAFTQLATVDIDGERHLRPEWQYVTDLLLTSDHDTWASTIQPVDPLAVARATPQRAAVDDRATAIEAIDNWYRNHRIFIPRTHEGQLVDDLAALELPVRKP